MQATKEAYEQPEKSKTITTRQEIDEYQAVKEIKPGLFRLDTKKQDNALSTYFQTGNGDGYIHQSIDIDPTKNIINPVNYFLNATDKIIIFATPINVPDLPNHLETLEENLNLENMDNYHLVIPLIGQGITERHIATYYQAPGTESTPMIFDSKIGNLVRFFSVKKNNESPKISYFNLGTQSFFDPVSCGYHTLANTTNILSLIQAGEEVNATSLLKALKKNNLSNFAIPLLKNSDIPLNINYRAFVQQAWRDTFLVGLYGQESSAITFKHYFLGWSTEKATWKRMLYITLLGFLFYPLISTLKLLIELPIQLLKHSVDYIKNQLFLWAPTSSSLQYSRTSLLLINYLFHGFLKGLNLIIHTGLSLIPTPCTLNTSQKDTRNNSTSTKVGDMTSDYDLLDIDDLVTKSHNPETTSLSNTSAKFFKPAVLQPKEQRQEAIVEPSV
jgi:hypothetical protein